MKKALSGTLIVVIAVIALAIVAFTVPAGQNGASAPLAIAESDGAVHGILPTSRLVGLVEYSLHNRSGEQVCYMITIHFRGRFLIKPVCKLAPGVYAIRVAGKPGVEATVRL